MLVCRAPEELKTTYPIPYHMSSSSWAWKTSIQTSHNQDTIQRYGSQWPHAWNMFHPQEMEILLFNFLKKIWRT